jgi:citrate synthase
MSSTLEQFEGPLPTSMGQAFPGQRAVFRGQDVQSDFWDTDWLDMYFYGISGKRLKPEEIQAMHSMFVYTSYPDARLWCNRISALTGSTRGTGALALAAGLAATEAGVYGLGPEVTIAEFLARALVATRDGANLDDLVRAELAQHRHMKGFGRPIATDYVDERIPASLARMKELGVPVGPHLALAFEVEDALKRITGKRLPMTMGAMIIAVPLDFGMTVREAYMCILPQVSAGMLPCYVEALSRPTGATFVMRCERIAYDGAAPRDWI